MRCPHCGRDFDPDMLIQDEGTRKQQAEEIYKLYPRKVGRPAALKAIMKALKQVPFVTLKKMVAELALAWDNHDTQYLPHPATWFNQERYNDAAETWSPKKQRENNGPPLFVQVQRLEQAIEVHPANPQWIGYSRDRVTDAARADLKFKRAKLHELQQQQLSTL